jgi:RNA polymerase sigma-70 factor, ECF subfamily
VPEQVCAPTADNRQLSTRLYLALDRIPVDERLPFMLRFMEGHTLAEVADLCALSLATARRRIARGKDRFLELAKADPLLSRFGEEGEHDGER